MFGGTEPPGRCREALSDTLIMPEPETETFALIHMKKLLRFFLFANFCSFLVICGELFVFAFNRHSNQIHPQEDPSELYKAERMPSGRIFRNKVKRARKKQKAFQSMTDGLTKKPADPEPVPIEPVAGPSKAIPDGIENSGRIRLVHRVEMHVQVHSL